MEFYYESITGNRGYRKMLNSWQERERNVQGNRAELADEARATITKQWLSEVNLEEIKQKVNKEERSGIVGERNDEG